MPTAKLLPLIPPGEILLEEFMRPLSVSQNRLARDIDVPPGRINQIVNGTRAITADTALRLARYFSTSAEFWLNLQQHYDLRVAERESWPRIAPKIRPLTSS
ncbi:MAG: HigA family addiction module antidote protein [Alphaproteobacteria bacterium]|nr:HigA family addiction module antidote protein [Alphaproteobacteria bacterium]